MKIAFFSNFLNHHQVNVADELYKMPGVDYFFVETVRMPQWLLNSGYPDLSDRPYVIKAWNSSKERNEATKLALEADVAMFAGHEVLEYEVARSKKGKLTFDVSERWLKKGWINVLSPRLIINQWYYHTVFKNKPVYKLCSSAYAAKDQYRLFSYKNRCFKWGYFTVVPDLDLDIIDNKFKGKIKMMWCARFLKWKHPELTIELAKNLKEKKYSFCIDMYGSGTEYDNILNLINHYDLNDVVKLCGNVPNAQILQEMKLHDIFIFTSDHNEGWGAVANEAMSSGCLLVGADAIGSIPFLVRDKFNGCIFKSNNIASLVKTIEWAIKHPIESRQMAKNAYLTIKDIWSAHNASKKLLQLISDIQNKKKCSVTEGPCSEALPL